MVSILIVHYYHIIILGGEILISACRCVEVVPVNMTLGLFCRDVQVAGFKKIKGTPPPQVLSLHFTLGHTISNEMSCQDGLTDMYLSPICMQLHTQTHKPTLTPGEPEQVHDMW